MNVVDRSPVRFVCLLSTVVLVVAACVGAPAGSSAASSSEPTSGTGLAASSGPLAANSPVANPPGSPSASPPPETSGANLTDATFKVSAREFSFHPKSLEVKAGKPFTIVFRNDDGPGVIHDVDIRTKNGKTVVVDQETVDGGQTAEYEYPKLEAGEYIFICSIHPIRLMTGTLTVR